MEQSHKSREEGIMKRGITAALSIGTLALVTQLMTAAGAMPLQSATSLLPADMDSVVKVHCVPGNVRCRAPAREVCVRPHPHRHGCCHVWGCRRPHGGY